MFLPKNYYIDTKDMGTGSYEAAQYLNTLPNTTKLNVWTDKTGVCYFLLANCYTGFSLPTHPKLDYIVVSSGRESRTQKLSRPKRNDTLDFSDYYSEDHPAVFKLNIDNRPDQYVKIIHLTENNE